MENLMEVNISDWYYDNNTYYPYLMLNGTELLFKNIQSILLANKLIVKHAGKSYRPASNGVQYNWFIRVFDSKNNHPQLKEIDAILSINFESNKIPSLNKLEYANKINILMEQKKSLLLEHKKLKNEIKRLEIYQSDELKKFYAEKEKIENETKRRVNELINLQEIAKKDSKFYREKSMELENYLIKIQNNKTSIKNQNENLIKQLYLQLESKENENILWIAEFEPEKIRLIEENINLKNIITKLEFEKTELIQTNHNKSSISMEISNKPISNEMFINFIETFLPTVKFIGDSIGLLYVELKDPVKVLYEIKLIAEENKFGSEKATKVQKTKDWFEIRTIGPEYRMYYRKEANKIYSFFISYKTDQRRDIDWLNLQ